jgi:hypothetical protein
MRLSGLVNDSAKDRNPTMLYNLTHEHNSIAKDQTVVLPSMTHGCYENASPLLGGLSKRRKDPRRLDGTLQERVMLCASDKVLHLHFGFNTSVEIYSGLICAASTA